MCICVKDVFFSSSLTLTSSYPSHIHLTRHCRTPSVVQAARRYASQDKTRASDARVNEDSVDERGKEKRRTNKKNRHTTHVEERCTMNNLSRGVSEVGGFFGSIRAMDFYRKIPRDLTEPTLAGGTMSVLSTIIMGVLLLWQVCLCARVLRNASLRKC